MILKWLMQQNINLIKNNYADNDFKYKEGNNRPSSVNQISLVHNHDKSGRQHEHSGNPSVWIGG